jgi:5-methylthioadenosine/S-adenosylhomocysteine deaminase
MEIDLILIHGTVIPMDFDRRILEDGAVAVNAGRILKVGKTSELESMFQARKTIDCRQHVVLPGLIDAHGHGGHSLMKGLLYERPSDWMKHLTQTYHHHTTDAFWYVDGKLSALERLKAGVTTGVSVIGSVPRSDTSIPGCNHARGYAEVGIREIVCTGPANPPWPHAFSRFDGEKWVTRQVPFEEALEGMEGVIQTWNHGANDRIRAYAAPFVIVTSVNPSFPTPPDIAIGLSEHDRLQMRRIREIAQKYHTRIHSDAFGGMIQMCYKDPYALLGPDVHLQHCRGISFGEAQILAETGTHVSSAPGPGQAKARCPVPELLSLGAAVAISTDGTAPAAPFDLFQAARKTQLVHQFMSHDGYYLPVGKLLEMITIDAAKVVGWDDELGSLEEGKKADIITVNLHAPHLTPTFLPVHRIIMEAVGHDVDTVIVDGQVVMQDRKVLTVDENDILAEAQEEAVRTIEQANLTEYLNPGPIIWKNPRLIFDA